MRPWTPRGPLGPAGSFPLNLLRVIEWFLICLPGVAWAMALLAVEQREITCGVVDEQLGWEAEGAVEVSPEASVVLVGRFRPVTVNGTPLGVWIGSTTAPSPPDPARWWPLAWRPR